MHTPVDATEKALAVVRERAADALVAVGGGSTTGLGKAIALRTDLPQIVLPTTYAGSEMTPILGETSGGAKTTQRSPKVLPEVVIYDVDLTLGLPPAVSATSGMNAIAHAVEALYAKDRNPVISMMAEEGISALARSLPRISADPHDREARSGALYGAWLCGTCLGAVGMALHHKLCHVLGGMFDLPARRDAHGRAAARSRLQRSGRAGPRWHVSRALSAAPTPRRAFTIWPAGSVRSAPCAISACLLKASSGSSTRPWPRRTGTRERWGVMPCVLCWKRLGKVDRRTRSKHDHGPEQDLSS